MLIPDVMLFLSGGQDLRFLFCDVMSATSMTGVFHSGVVYSDTLWHTGNFIGLILCYD